MERTSARVRTTGSRSGRFARQASNSPFQRPIEDNFVKEEQGAHRLVLGRSGDVHFDGQMSEEGFDASAPISMGCRLPWNTTNRLTHWT